MSLLACDHAHDAKDLGASDLHVEDLATACTAAGGVCFGIEGSCASGVPGGALGCSYLCCLPPPQCTFSCDLAQCPCPALEAVCIDSNRGATCVCASQGSDAGTDESFWSCGLGM
jgi:hypothetical protein